MLVPATVSVVAFSMTTDSVFEIVMLAYVPPAFANVNTAAAPVFIILTRLEFATVFADDIDNEH